MLFLLAWPARSVSASLAWSYQQCFVCINDSCNFWPRGRTPIPII